MRGRAEVARRAHNPEVSGSNPLPATVFQAPIFGRFWFKHALIHWYIYLVQEYHSNGLVTIYQFG